MGEILGMKLKTRHKSDAVTNTVKLTTKVMHDHGIIMTKISMLSEEEFDLIADTIVALINTNKSLHEWINDDLNAMYDGVEDDEEYGDLKCFFLDIFEYDSNYGTYGYSLEYIQADYYDDVGMIHEVIFESKEV